MKLEFSQQIFEKFSNIKFHEDPSSESRVVLCGQHDDAIRRFSQNSKKRLIKQETDGYVICVYECSSPAGRHSPDRLTRHQSKTNEEETGMGPACVFSSV